MFNLRAFSLSLLILIGNIPCTYGYPPSHENTNRTNAQTVQQSHNYGLYLLAGVIIAGILWNKAGLSIDNFVDYCQHPAKARRTLNDWWTTKHRTYSNPNVSPRNAAPSQGTPQAPQQQNTASKPRPSQQTTPQPQSHETTTRSHPQPTASQPSRPTTTARPQQTPATQAQVRQTAQIIAEAAATRARASQAVQSSQAVPQITQNPETLLQSWGYEIIDRYPGRRIWQARSATHLPGGWACGAFSLHNAHNIEGILGLARVPNSLQALNQASVQRGIQLTGGIDNHELIDLAQDIQLHDFYAAQVDSTGHLVPLFNSTSNMRFNNTVHTPRGQATAGLHTIDVDVTVPYHWSERSAKQYADQIFKAKCRELLEATRDRLLSQDRQPHVTHFGCILPEHVVLASAIKLPGQQPFVVLLDNTNERLSQNSLTQDQLVQIADLIGA